MRRLWAVAVLLVFAAPVAVADDPDPPEFKGASLEPGPYAPGDMVPFELSWEDASGVASVWADATGPNGLHVQGMECASPEGRRVVTVACSIKLHPRTPGGAYRLSHSHAQDVVGHHAGAELDVPFTVESPFDDTEGPHIVGLEQNATDVVMEDAPTHGQTIVVDEAFWIEGTDASDIIYAGLSFHGPNDNRGLHVQCDRWAGHRSACTLYADPEIPAGDYVLDQMWISDEIGYHRHYQGWQDGFSAILPAPAVITVASDHVDDTAPVLTHLTFPAKLHRGQPFELRFNATDETIVEAAQVHFQTTRGNAGYSIWHLDQCRGEPAADRQMVCTGRFPDNFPLGLAIVDWVFVEDQGRNHAWYQPVEWGGWGQSFSDNDHYDVGTVLEPRPLEGVIEAIDALVNEVMPGQVATIVYRTQDTADDVLLVLEDATDGSSVEVECLDAVVTAIGQECTFQVPDTEEGVLSLVAATVTGSQGNSTSTYAAGQVPLLAVTQKIPASAGMPLATGGGALNNVGGEWMETFRQESGQESNQRAPDEEEPVHSDDSLQKEKLVVDEKRPPPSLRPVVEIKGMHNMTQAEPPRPEPAQPIVDHASDAEVPMAWVLPLVAIFCGSLLRRR